MSFINKLKKGNGEKKVVYKKELNSIDSIDLKMHSIHNDIDVAKMMPRLSQISDKPNLKKKLAPFTSPYITI